MSTLIQIEQYTIRVEDIQFVKSCHCGLDITLTDGKIVSIDLLPCRPLFGAMSEESITKEADAVIRANNLYKNLLLAWKPDAEIIKVKAEKE